MHDAVIENGKVEVRERWRPTSSSGTACGCRRPSTRSRWRRARRSPTRPGTTTGRACSRCSPTTTSWWTARGERPRDVAARKRHTRLLRELEPLLEIRQAPVYFAVPGMHGGFSYTLEADGEQSRLVVESWCRLAGGPASGMWCPPRGVRWLTKGSSEPGEGRVALQRLRDRVAPRRARDNIPRCLC